MPLLVVSESRTFNTHVSSPHIQRLYFLAFRSVESREARNNREPENFPCSLCILRVFGRCNSTTSIVAIVQLYDTWTRASHSKYSVNVPKLCVL